MHKMMFGAVCLIDFMRVNIQQWEKKKLDLKVSSVLFSQGLLLFVYNVSKVDGPGLPCCW